MKYITILLISLFLLSCGKKTTVTGRVYNPITGEEYQGITISVLRDRNCISWDGCGEKVHKSTETDENGEFAITFRRKGGDHLVVNYDKSHYYAEGGQQIFENVENVDFPITPYGMLQERIVNVDCFDNSDNLTITEMYKKSNPSVSLFTAGNNPSLYNGCFDQTFSNSRVPMGWYVYKGTVTKNNVTTPFVDSVYVPEGEYVLWEIEW